MSQPVDFFPNFASHWIDTDAGKIFARSAGSGPPLVLLHGFPQSMVMWRRVAPLLTQHFHVVVMDLRGYGWSSAPDSDNGELYTKRIMAGDVVQAMEELGHIRFHLAGHDRGARLGYRLALDHPGRIEKLVLLDILPTVEVWKNIRSGKTPAAHWTFLSQPAPTPEHDIATQGPDAYFEGLLAKWSKSQTLSAFDRAALEAYRSAWGDTSRIHAFCEDYRAGAAQDLAADEADVAARKTLSCPAHILWGNFYLTAGATTPLDVWRAGFAPQATGTAIDSGHFLAEENPQATAEALLSFF
jgi:haloacetate dehalogenase